MALRETRRDKAGVYDFNSISAQNHMPATRWCQSRITSTLRVSSGRLGDTRTRHSFMLRGVPTFELLISRITGKVRTGPRAVGRNLVARLDRLTLQQKASGRVPLTA